MGDLGLSKADMEAVKEDLLGNVKNDVDIVVSPATTSVRVGGQ